MVKRLFVASLLILCFEFTHAQHSIRCVVKDSINGELLPGVNIVLENTGNGVTTDLNGRAELKNIPEGSQILIISFIGYKTKAQSFTFPIRDNQENQTILLAFQHEELEEILISSYRTNARIEDLPTKVEVLGQEEMNEESSVVPGSVASILGDLSVITIQRTNSVNANDVIRIQGLNARYTQILRDGLPLYGGFSGSLGVLSIPPLDLKQVEIIKGSSSTLYGGGAIGGLLNFISKTPEDSAHSTIIFNGSTLKESNINSFVSKKSQKIGMTIFSGANIKSAVDVNGDGFAEVPSDINFTAHPRLFFYLNKKSDLNIGFTGNYDKRKGGDIDAIQFKPDSAHPFLQTEELFRSTLDAQFHTRFNEKNNLTVKTAGNFFNRMYSVPSFNFNGYAINSFTEISDYMQFKKQSLVAGINLTSEQFQKQKSDTVLFSNYENYVPGIFLQHTWEAHKKLSVETGLRADNHNKFGNFILPRLSFFYKPESKFSVRLAFGSGYKVPSLFDFAEPSAKLIDYASNIKPEKSKGINSDINYHTLLFDDLGFELNQAFYYTFIDNINILTSTNSGQVTIENGNFTVNSYGTDTYIRLTYDEIELYLGYNHTEAFQDYSSVKFNMPFNPGDKFSTTLAYEIEGKWRMGIEASYNANQFIQYNIRVRDNWFAAAMIERKLSFGSLVLNCEDVFDERQSKYESLVDGTRTNPSFRPAWMNTEGRVINLALKITL